MGIWAWIMLWVSAALLATGARVVLSRDDRRATKYDWASLASGAFLGGFVGSVGWVVGPMVDGLVLLPALARRSRNGKPAGTGVSLVSPTLPNHRGDVLLCRDCQADIALAPTPCP